VRIAIVVLLLAVARVAAAHPLDMAYLRVERGTDEIATVFDLDVTVAEGLLKVDRLDAQTAAARATELARATYRMATPSIDGTPCTWIAATAKITGRSVSISDRASCPRGRALAWEMPFVKRMASSFQVLAKVNTKAASNVIVLEKDRLRIDDDSGEESTTGIAGVLWRGGFYLMFALAIVLAGLSLRAIIRRPASSPG
jgi:hypothetical protein